MRRITEILMRRLSLVLQRPDAPAKALEKQVKQFIKPYSFLKIADKADFQLEVKKDGEGKQATLTDRNNKTIWSASILNKDSLSAEQKKQFIADIKKELRIKYLRTMPDGGELALCYGRDCSCKGIQ